MGYDSDILISKEEIPYIKELLLEQGFVEEFSNKKSKLYVCFFWKYIDDNFKYYEGTSFSIIKSRGKYYVCGRNSASCSSFDLKLHNNTLLFLKKVLKRDFTTDDGRNKPFKLFKSPYGMTNALAFSFSDLSNKLSNVLYFLSAVRPLSDSQKSLDKLFGGFTVFNQESFSVNLLNTYLASTLECYFRSTFHNILKCLDKTEVERIRKIKRMPDYIKRMLKNKEIDLYNAISHSHSFQNIDSVINVFMNCFNIDLSFCLNKKGYGTKTRKMVLYDIYSTRHDNVHSMKYDYMSINTFLKTIAVLSKTLNSIYKHLCKAYKVPAVELILSYNSFKKVKQVMANRSYKINVSV